MQVVLLLSMEIVLVSGWLGMDCVCMGSFDLLERILFVYCCGSILIVLFYTLVNQSNYITVHLFISPFMSISIRLLSLH